MVAREQGVAILHRPAPGHGFFSNLRWILDLLDEVERGGWIPVIDQQTQPTHFNEPEPVAGTRNAWEYYFEQPAGLGLDAVDRRHAVELGARPSGRLSQPETLIGAAELARGRQLVARYVRPRSGILAAVQRFTDARWRPPVLGVHVRGTDLRQGIYPNHPLPPGIAATLERARQLDAQQRFGTVFLACDEVEPIFAFARDFGARLQFTDAFRVSQRQVARHDYRWWFEHRRPQHRYLLGREVLIDALLLGRCDTLLGSWSNVVDGALLLAPTLPVVHELRPVAFAPARPGGPGARLVRLSRRARALYPPK